MSELEDDRWWENRFSEEERRNMSVLGRVLFTGEVTPRIISTISDVVFCNTLLVKGAYSRVCNYDDSFDF